MTDPEYMDRAEAALAASKRGCDRINDETDADIDNQRVGGMITSPFATAARSIVNLQKPLHEIWMAARSGGFHYGTTARAGWTPRRGGEFFAQPVARGERAGRPAAAVRRRLSRA